MYKKKQSSPGITSEFQTTVESVPMYDTQFCGKEDSKTLQVA